VLGAATIGADLAVTGNITGGGLRKYAQAGAPTNPVVGDVWYKTDTDVYYQYINDGTNKYWVDYSSATVSNASPTTSQSLQDLQIVSGTPSTSTSTGALVVQGGIGASGNVFVGNLSTATVSAGNFTYANGVSILVGNEGTYSNANVTAYLTARTTTISDGFLSSAGMTVTAGNLKTTSANIGGVVIESGGIGQLASLGVLGAATIGGNVAITGDVAITGNISAGGLRKYAQPGAPANPIVGDVWYKTDTDVFYQYVDDGTSKYWIDYTSATVSNANPTSPQSLQDLQIVSGTPSTNTTSGALQVTGGAGISGNVNAGNVTTGTITATTVNSSGVVVGTGFTYANGVSILVGNEGTYSNANVTAYLTARTTTISDGFLSTAGMTVTAGNLKTASANIGGVIIEAGGIGSLANLNVIGGATIGGDVTITGNVTGGGIRKTTSASAPVNPVVGDQWYKSDTDTLYQYINDGTTKYWVDVAGATVSNASITSDQIAYDIVITTDTQSTSTTTGAVRVQGGIGLIGNIYTTGIADFGGNLTAGNILANNNLQTTTLQVIGDTNVNKLTAVGNITSSGTYFSAGGISVTNGNVVATGTTATIGGLVINNGGLPSLPTLGVIGAATFGANVDVTGNVNITRDIIASGNIVAGGVRKYAQTTKPANAVPGDVWYKTDTDVYYTYVNDGTSSYWIDYVGATVSNAAVDNSTNNDFTIASGTASTDADTGALVVVGGVGVTGDINVTGDFSIDGTFTACTAVTAGYLNVADGIDSYGNVVIHGPGTPNYTVQVRSSDAADDVLGIKTSVAGGGFEIDALNNELTGATPFGINANTFSIGIKNAIGSTVQADAFKINTAGNASVAKTLSVGQHVNVTGNVNAGVGTFTSLFASSANLTTLNLSSTLTVPTLNVTTSIDAPGIRKYAQTTAPVSPAVGDVWYKTDTDVYYTYVNDGTTNYWIDYVSATVSNAATTASQSVDLRVASGTESINTDTGAITVVGGVGVVGNIFAGGIVSAQGQLRAISGVQSTSTTTGALVVTGGLGVSANTNIGGALAADSLTVAGPTNLSGNLSGTNMSLAGRADIAGAMAISGAATIGGNLDVTGRVVGGGIRKTTSINAPANPTVGDIWYKTDTDVLYQYTHDGTNNFWIDYVGPSVSNASPSTGLLSDLEVVTGTSSTSTITGAARITGGVGITENLYVGGLSIIGANLVANNITANLNLQSATLAVTGAGTIGGNLTSANLSTGIASIARADIAGALAVGGDVTVTGNIVAGGVRKTQSTTAPVNPTVGDLWYKTDTDVYYQYTSDGTNKYWIDYVGATVSNAAVSASTNNDYRVASGTESTDVDTGALTVVGGVGITGNVFAGNATATSFRSDNFIFANGQSLASRITGTFSNTNVAAYLTGAITTGNIAAGNIIAANVSALDIVARDVTLSGNITGGGLRKYAQLGAPANPVVGDVWYKTDTDVYYQYINDGTNNYWVDYIGATISNATVNNSTNSDFLIASGTLSTSNSTGALQVVGGVGVVGNVNLGGNLKADGTVTGTAFTYANGVSILVGNEGTYSNANVTAYLTARNVTIADGNIVATGSYLSAGGFTATAGNIFAPSANIGGLVISNGGLSSLASLGVIGSATVGADLAVTGNITGGGLRKTQSTTPPVNPVQGDVWYKTDTDVYYQYINDGTASYWIDYAGATVSNAAVDNSTNSNFSIASGTESTSTSTGALTVVGGIGATGNLNLGANATISGNVVIDGDARATQHNTGALVIAGNGGASIGGNLFIQGAIEIDRYFVSQSYAEFGEFVGVNGNIIGRGNKITGGGFQAEYGNVTATGQYFSAGGLTALAGNVTLGNIVGYGFSTNNGNLITTGSRAVVGGLTIENGAFGNVASLGVIGSVTIGNDLAVTGNITGGGIRKTQSTTAPVNPVQGDVWYKTDTDVFYQYVNDGTNTYWIDYTSATVANISTANAQYGTDVGFVSGTLSTDQTTGAVVVIGGVGVTGNINLTGQVTALDTVTGQRIVSNTSITGATLSIAGAAVVGNLTAGNITGYGFSTNNGNVTATGQLTVGGLAQIPGNLSATGSYFSAGGLSVTAGNITAYGFSTSNGNVIATGTYAQIGGLEIINGGFGSLASLGVVGSATIGGDVTITGNVTGGGIRKTTSTNAPVNPIVGDIWYKTDTDVYYEYINDGTGTYWVDMVSPTVANVTQSAETVSDLEIVSGTPSIDSTSGALRVAGGVGVVGDVNISANITVGNVIAGTVYTPAIRATAFTYPNGASILDGYYFGTYSNANVGGYLTAQGITTTGGNLVATGQYFSAAGLSVTAGNITAQGFSTSNGNILSTGARAVVGGLTIENGSFADITSLGVIGNITAGGDVIVTGNISGGGLRKYAQTFTPANPIVGDVWYKTDTDVYYQFVNDGTSTYWIDYTSAAIANITVANSQYGSDVGFVSGTLSTDQTTGAVVVIGGVGITGNINLTGKVTALDTITGQSIVSNTSVAGATLSIAGNAVVGNLTAGNITAYGFSTNNGNVTATGQLTVGGLSVVPGNLSATGSYLAVNGFTALNGNITATGTTAVIGGLTIANGGFGSIASLDVIGSATIGGNVTITGNVVGGGIRKTTSISAPASPTVGDQWYKTDTDILYQYIDDGTNTYWVDFASATVANITNDFDGLGDFQTIGNVIGNGIVSDNYYYANGVSFVTTTVANTQNIVANITNGFNLGLDLTPTGVAAGNYGSATSIPTVVVDDKGRITSITSNSVSTTFGLVGNVGTSSINGGNTLVVVGVPNQISTTVAGNTISIGFTPNISFTDFTVNGNLIYQGGGIKTTTSPTPPPGPVNGDMWYQSGTDILYRYIFDGTNEYWIDLFSTPLRAVLPSQDIAGGDGEVQFNDNGTFGANANFAFDKTTGTLKVERFRVTKTQSPATPGSPGLTGEITWDGGWLYVCVAPNSWVRAGLYTW